MRVSLVTVKKSFNQCRKTRSIFLHYREKNGSRKALSIENPKSGG